ncbi:MAG TPA: Gfo/Idh/MocA family oxidoreductase [Methylotenera sp.]|nr:Gfo/Idh/MocA family oxidoreductase [Methylotenera sp.]HPH04754.1 Gfo/Idh/MocA family oxidoreductase [Methylotenera sp.]HPN01197.1 Gfo/Idh/MocA family oxidoreductase [Methylotenera sp.]
MRKYLVVSAGSIGARHIRNIRILFPDSVIAVLRLNSDTSSALPEFSDLQFFSINDALLFNPSAALIASPASTHVEIAAKLVNMGVPVLIEKPFSNSMTQIKELVDTAKLQQIPIMIGYNLRFKSSLIEARRRVVNGSIGQVSYVRASVGQYLPDWRPNSDYKKNVTAQKKLGGGALLELSHEIDYIYWMFGMPQGVFCIADKLSSLDIDVEDTVEIVLLYQNPKRIISIHLDFIQRQVSRSCSFVGTEGTLIWDGIKDNVEIYNASSKSIEVANISNQADSNQCYLDEIEHFLKCVETHTEPTINATQGIDVMEIIEAAKRSMHSKSVETLTR